MDQSAAQALGFLIIIIIAHYVGKDAVKHGMSYWPWALFVLFFCIIALPIYLIARKPLVAVNNESNQSGGSIEGPTKKCSDCAETIRLEAARCRYCGKVFEAPQVAQQG